MKTFKLSVMAGMVLGLALSAGVPGFAARQGGLLEPARADGALTGWALDRDQPGIKVRVAFYVDNPKGKGSPEIFFEALADKPSTNAEDSAHANGHRFEAKIPNQLGDEKQHVFYAYALIGNDALPLSGSPQKFSFRWQPDAALAILSPKPGETIKDKNLKIKYSVSGDKKTYDNIQWVIDNGVEVRDLDRKGTYQIPNLSPGKHTLTGHLGRGHHERVLNSEVSVEFTVPGEKAGTPQPKNY